MLLALVMRDVRPLSLLAAALLHTAACLSEDDGSEPAATLDFATTAQPVQIPSSVLGPGAHVGTWTTYEQLPAAVQAQVDLRLSHARVNGLSVGRVHVSWGELEPAPGVFNLAPLQNGLAQLASQGLAAHVLIETVDSDGLELPADLEDHSVSSDAYRLIDDRRLDDPLVLARFGALLAQVTPLLARYKVFALSVANEPDAYFDDYLPGTARGDRWSAGLLGFIANAKARVQLVAPNLPVAMTLRQGSLRRSFGSTVTSLARAGDVAVFNYYCQDDNFQVRPAAGVAADLDQLVATASGRAIVFQELGCPAGVAPSTIAASDAAQAAFYRAVFQAMPARPTIRAAFAFQLVDWSPALARAYGDAYRAAGFPQLAGWVEETMRSTGLLRYADGSVRPAYAEWLRAVDTLH